MNFWRRLWLGAAALAAIGAPLMFGVSAAQHDATPPGTIELRAQQAAQFGPSIKYDVVSIKPSSLTPVREGRILPDGLTLSGIPLQGLFIRAYGTPRYLIVGEPDWWSTQKYDVLAKTDGAVAEKLQK